MATALRRVGLVAGDVGRRGSSGRGAPTGARRRLDGAPEPVRPSTPTARRRLRAAARHRASDQRRPHQKRAAIRLAAGGEHPRVGRRRRSRRARAAGPGRCPGPAPPRRTTASSRSKASSTWPLTRSRSAASSWACDVGGVGRRGPASSAGRARTARANSPACALPSGGLGVVRVGLQQQVELVAGRGEVAGAPGPRRPRRSAGRLPLVHRSPAAVPAARRGHRLRPADHPVGEGGLEHLVDGLLHLVARQHALEQRHAPGRR